MAAAPKSKCYTEEEYLAFERESKTKHQLIGGEIYAIAGASPQHNFICANLYGIFYTQLRSKTCRYAPSDLKVKVSKVSTYSYADAVIFCGKPEYDEKHYDILLNPTVIVEVLSPSTEQFDRDEKFIHYQMIESLREYVLVSQDVRRIEAFTRRDGAGWVYHHIPLEGAEIVLASIGCTLRLTEVYEDVETYSGTSPASDV